METILLFPKYEILELSRYIEYSYEKIIKTGETEIMDEINYSFKFMNWSINASYYLLKIKNKYEFCCFVQNVISKLTSYSLCMNKQKYIYIILSKMALIYTIND